MPHKIFSVFTINTPYKYHCSFKILKLIYCYKLTRAFSYQTVLYFILVPCTVSTTKEWTNTSTIPRLAPHGTCPRTIWPIIPFKPYTINWSQNISFLCTVNLMYIVIYVRELYKHKFKKSNDWKLKVHHQQQKEWRNSH